MSRQILFRGKTYDGEWIYGDLLRQYGATEIYISTDTLGEYDFPSYLINPETVGQFTGLTDKNGNKIFEGDIVKWNEKEWGCPHNELVKFDYELLAMRKYDYEQWCEVIGNIFDNEELLGE